MPNKCQKIHNTSNAMVNWMTSFKDRLHCYCARPEKIDAKPKEFINPFGKIAKIWLRFHLH